MPEPGHDSLRCRCAYGETDCGIRGGGGTGVARDDSVGIYAGHCERVGVVRGHAIRRSRRRRVVDTVGEKMKGILTKADYGKLQSGYTRWRNRVAWQASNMRRDGYIRNDSPRGVWEITDAGRKWLDKPQ